MTDQEAWCAVCHMMKYGIVEMTTFSSSKHICELKFTVSNLVDDKKLFAFGETENQALKALYDEFLERFPYGG